MIVDSIVLHGQRIGNELHMVKGKKAYDVSHHEKIEILANEGILVILNMSIFHDERVVDTLLLRYRNEDYFVHNAFLECKLEPVRTLLNQLKHHLRRRSLDVIAANTGKWIHRVPITGNMLGRIAAIRSFPTRLSTSIVGSVRSYRSRHSPISS